MAHTFEAGQLVRYKAVDKESVQSFEGLLKAATDEIYAADLRKKIKTLNESVGQPVTILSRSAWGPLYNIRFKNGVEVLVSIKSLEKLT